MDKSINIIDYTHYVVVISPVSITYPWVYKHVDSKHCGRGGGGVGEKFSNKGDLRVLLSFKFI